MSAGNEENMVEDADIDGIGERSWFGGLLRGVLFGGLGAVLAVIALSLSHPLPEHLPGVGKVDVVGLPATGDAASETEAGTTHTIVQAQKPEPPAETGDENPVAGSSDTSVAADEDASSPSVSTGDAPKTEVASTPPVEAAGSQEDTAPQSDAGRVTPGQETSEATVPAGSGETASGDPGKEAELSLPETSETQTSETQTSETQTSETQTSETGPSETESSEPSTSDTGSAEVKDDTAQSAATEAEPDTTGTSVTESGATNPETTGPETAQTDTMDTPTAGPESSDTETTETSAQDAVRAEPTTTQTDSPETDMSGGAETGATEEIALAPGVPAEGEAQPEPQVKADTGVGAGAADADVESTESPKLAAAGTSDPAPVPEIALAGPALSVNAQMFEAPPDAPLLAVVLEEPGGSDVEASEMALMTMPLTFAVRPDRPGARALAEAIRQAGHEVVVSLPLALADSAADNPTPYAEAGAGVDAGALTLGYLAALDLAIGATAPADAPVLNDQRQLTTVLRPLAEHGFAYLDQRPGIGSPARRVATRSGFIYVESDRYSGRGATETQIYQMLDGAAFLARRSGAAVVSVVASQDAFKAIIRLGLERGGQGVWFAPLSAVIARRENSQ